MHHLPAPGDKIILTGMADDVLFGKLPGADGDKIRILSPDMAACGQCQGPARFAIAAPGHGLHGGIQAKQPGQIMFGGIGLQIGMDLRALGPFGIVGGHRVIGVAIQVLGRLGLHIGIRPRQIPHAAEIAAALKPHNAVALFIERLGRCQPADPAANDGNPFAIDHAHPPMPRPEVAESQPHAALTAAPVRPDR